MNKLIILIILIFIFKTETVFSRNIVYDVNNIKIIGKISSELDRNKLLDLSFKKAFTKFINKTLLENDIKKLSNIDLKEIKNLIFSYQISKNEINKNKKNILTINIKFDQKKVNNFLAAKGIPYADVSDISLTVFTVLVKGKEIFLYSDNYFYNNWNNLNPNETEENFITYNLSLENIEDLEYFNNNKNNLELIDGRKLTTQLENKNYALIIIYSSEDKLKTFVKTSINKKEVNKNFKFDLDNNEESISYDYAIKELKNQIGQIWKSQNLIDINTPSYLDFFLKLQDIDDYLKIKQILDKIDIIENYSVLELTRDHAKIRVKYNGKIIKIKEKLIEQKININIIENQWNLEII